MNEYLYGGNYYPLVEDKANWEKDLRTMAENGVNYVRTAEIFNGWDQLEPKEGVYRFEELNDFFDLALKYNIKILLGTGTNAPPVWLSKKDPQVNVLSSTGNQFPVNVTYGWACYNNPTMRQSSINYITALVEHFKSHKALMGYQINNEIGYPFMPLSEGGALEDYCHCEHCQTKFRKWVENKYKTIDKLNHAWRWGATNQYHMSFDEVESPKAKPTSWASVTRWLDWRLFHMDTISNQVKFEHELLKSLDDKPTACNIFFMKSQDPLGVTTALDQFTVAKYPDYIGYDLYPGSGDKLEYKPEFSSMFLDHARSVSKPLGKTYWLSEAEGGPIGGWILGPEKNTNGDDIVRNIMETIAHDGKSILYQLYKELEFQPLHWGGVINLDGSTNERTEKTKFLADFIKSREEFLMSSKTRKGQVAILLSKENEIIMNGVGHQQFFLEELRGTYKFYWAQGYNIDFIQREHLNNDYKNDYDIIHAPFLSVIDDETIDGIEEFVSQGGTFITGARFAFMTPEGWYRYPIFDGKVKELIGATIGEVDAKVNEDILYKNEKLKGYWHKEYITPTTATTLASYEDESPAVIQNKYKNGNVIYFTTHFGNEYLNGDGTLQHILVDLFTQKNILPDTFVEYKGKEYREVDCHILETEDKAMIILTKYFNKSQAQLIEDGLKVKVGVKLIADTLVNYSTVSEVPFTINGDYTEFEVMVDDNEFYVFEVTKC